LTAVNLNHIIGQDRVAMPYRQLGIDKSGAFISSLPGIRRANILPYHCTAAAKHKNPGLNFRTTEVVNPNRDFLVSIAGRLEKFGLQVKIGG